MEKNTLASFVESSLRSENPYLSEKFLKKVANSKRPDLDFLRSARRLKAFVDRRNKKDEDEFQKHLVALNTIAAAAVKLLPTSEVKNGISDEYAALYAKAKRRFNAGAKKGAEKKT